MCPIFLAQNFKTVLSSVLHDCETQLTHVANIIIRNWFICDFILILCESLLMLPSATVVQLRRRPTALDGGWHASKVGEEFGDKKGEPSTKFSCSSWTFYVVKYASILCLY